MPIDITTLPSLLLTGIQTNLMQKYSETEKEYTKIAGTVKSFGASENYPYFENVSDIDQWIDEVEEKNVESKDFTIVNKDFNDAIRISLPAMKDLADRINALGGTLSDGFITEGNVGQAIAGQAFAFGRFYDKLIFTLLTQGTSTTGTGLIRNMTITAADGAAMFGNHTTNGGGTQTNLGSTALSSTSYGTTKAAMRKLKDGSGNPAGVRGNVLVVGPDLESAARELLNSQFYPTTISNGTKLADNVWKGTADLIVSSFITDANDWYLLDTTKPYRPLMVQDRQGFEVLPPTMKGKYYTYNTWLRGAAFFTDWKLAYANIVS